MNVNIAALSVGVVIAGLAIYKIKIKKIGPCSSELEIRLNSEE